MSEKEKIFCCKLCNFNSKYQYFGLQPPFAKSIQLLEKSYVSKDPFTDEGGFIVLGSHCAVCNSCVCVGLDCSIFYTKRFCTGCLEEHLGEFPDEMRQEITNRTKLKKE